MCSAVVACLINYHNITEHGLVCENVSSLHVNNKSGAQERKVGGELKPRWSLQVQTFPSSMYVQLLKKISRNCNINCVQLIC